MSYNDDEIVGGIGVDNEEKEEETFSDDNPLGEDFLDDEDEEDKVPEGFLADTEE